MRKSDRFARAEEEASRGTPVWLIGALGAGFGLVVGVILLIAVTSGSGSPQDSPDPGPPEAHQPKRPKKPRKAVKPAPGPGTRDKPAPPPKDNGEDPDPQDEWEEEEDLSPREQLNRAKRYLDEHPGEYDRALGVLQIILRRYQDLYKEEVEKEIVRVTEKRNADADKEYDKRRVKAQAALDGERFKEAHEIMREFPERFFGARSYERAQEFAKLVMKQVRDRFDGIRTQARALASEGRFDKACELLKGARSLGVPRILEDVRFELSRIDRLRAMDENARKQAEAEEKERAAAEARKVLETFMPGHREKLKSREYDEAERAIETALSRAGNRALRDLLTAEMEDLAALKKIFTIVERGLKTLVGETVTLHPRGKARKGELVHSAGNRWGLRSAGSTVGFALPSLSAEDVESVLKGISLRSDEQRTLGLFLLAEERPVGARQALEKSGTLAPRLQKRLKVAEIAASRTRVDKTLERAGEALKKKDFDGARALLDDLEASSRTGLSEKQKERILELRTEIETEVSGIRTRFHGGAWLLPDKRTRLRYGFDADDELLDWQAKGDRKAAIIMDALELQNRTVLWSRFKLSAPWEISLDASGTEIDLNLGGKGDGEWKDGLHLVIGRGREIILHRNGRRIGSWPIRFDRRRTYRLRLTATTQPCRLHLYADETRIFEAPVGNDPDVFSGRTGLWGFPAKNRYDNIELKGIVTQDEADAAPVVKELPKSPVRLNHGDVDKEWQKWRGKWTSAKSEIKGNGKNAGIITKLLAEYTFTEYLFQVEVRPVRGQAFSPGVVFPYGGRYPTWTFDKGDGRVNGLPDATALKHSLNPKKWNVLRVICRKGKVEGWIGKRRCWVTSNAASARSPLDKCPPGLGLLVITGHCVFRNPVITLIK